MFFLTLNAAISKGFTGGACLQFYFVDFCDAAGSANVGRLSVLAAHYFNLSLFFHYDYDVGVSASQQTSSKQAARERERRVASLRLVVSVFVEVVLFLGQIVCVCAAAMPSALLSGLFDQQYPKAAHLFLYILFHYVWYLQYHV